MPRRSSKLLRLFTLAFVLAFGLNASHAATVFKPSTCAHCPPDCPMHKQNRKCHESPAKGSHCHREAKGPGIHAAGCKSKADGFVAADPPSILSPSLVAGMTWVDRPLATVGELGESRDGFALPLLHPPASL